MIVTSDIFAAVGSMFITPEQVGALRDVYPIKTQAGAEDVEKICPHYLFAGKGRASGCRFRGSLKLGDEERFGCLNGDREGSCDVYRQHSGGKA